MAVVEGKRFIIEDDVKAINARFQDWKGVSEPEYDNFIKTMNGLIRKDKWGVNDLRYLKARIEAVNTRPHLEYIFLVLNNHPQWPKYFKDLVPINPPIAIAKMRKELESTPKKA